MNATAPRPLLLAVATDLLAARQAQMLATQRQQVVCGSITLLFTPADLTPEDCRTAAAFLLRRAEDGA